MEASDVVAQVDELRKHVNLADTLRSIESWSEAEASESPSPRVKRRRPKYLATPSANVAKNESLPLQCSPAAIKRTPSPNRRADPSSSVSRDQAEDGTATEARSSTRAFNKLHAASKKNDQLKSRKDSAAEQQRTNGRRRLRAKLANVLAEVRRRQFLREQQEKAKKFREDRFARGIGPQATLGDATEEAFGLCDLGDEDDALSSSTKAAIYRRSALLDALSYEELAMIRSEPEWFFSGSAFAAALPSQPVSAQPSIAASHPSPSTLHSSAKSSNVAGNMAIPGPCELEDLIDFFSVTETEKGTDVRLYARDLRQHVRSVDGRRQMPGMSEAVDLRKTLCRTAESVEEPTVVAESAPAAPLEMMPCLGRHPQIRRDEESPTLMKVREVYKRKDEQDERWVEERREGILRRLALNSFKAREQQRELLLHDFKHKELHKLRMLSAEEKKSRMNAEQEERAELQTISKIQRVYYAAERSEKATEDKRDLVSESLEKWRARVAGASYNTRKMEIEKIRNGERRQQKYNERVNAIGERRKITVVSQSRKNDELKKRIQTSLSGQLAEQRRQDCLASAEELQAKLEAAAIRRQQGKLGHRYGFTERAFGESALGFDAKYHSVATDRRGESWQNVAEEWDALKASFSIPDISAPRPLSPGGGLNEIAFKIQAPLEKSASAPRLLGS